MKTYLIAISQLLILFLCGCTAYHPADLETAEQPSIYPYYADVTFPCNIAPPNFIIRTEGERFQTEFGLQGEAASFWVGSGDSIVKIPMKKWRELTEKAAGKSVYFRISVRQGDQWVRYADITNRVSEHAIDPYLTYRLLYPGYELWNDMGIYQRELSSYKEEAVAANRNFGHQCVNCHSYNQYRPDEMMLHVRGPKGGTLIVRDGKVEKVHPKAPGFKYGPTYPAWHPSGMYIFFASNAFLQFLRIV